MKSNHEEKHKDRGFCAMEHPAEDMGCEMCVPLATVWGSGKEGKAKKFRCSHYEKGACRYCRMPKALLE